MTGLFLPGVAEQHVLHRLALAGGNEVGSGKLASPESSAALAVNTFGWFIDRPQLLPPFKGADSSTPVHVDVEYCARFPWNGGRHPWLDAAVETATSLIGIESKRFEPFRDAKKVSLSAAYDRPVWGERMGAFEALRDRLRDGRERFDHLDATQLVKHAFGLVSDARRKDKLPCLVYLYAEPAERAGRMIDAKNFALHRGEIDRFAEAIAGSEVAFVAVSYREWLATWRGPEVEEHARNIIDYFAP